MKNKVFGLRTTDEQIKEWQEKARKNGFESLTQFIKWLLHNSDRILKKTTK